MAYIALAAVVAILLLQWTGSLPNSSVGGPLLIALVYFVAVIAMAVHEAWTKKRSVIGWIVNVVVAVLGAFIAAQVGGMLMVMLLGGLGQMEGSLAKTGGPVFSIALVGSLLATLFGAWGAIQIVNRWR